MLGPIKHILNSKRIILASGSPRRQELINNIGLNVELCPSLFEENLDPLKFKNFSEFVEETAYEKAKEVYERLVNMKSEKPPDIVIAADTMVTLGDKMFGKPKSPEVAFQMLSQLIDKEHIVYTGVAIKHDKGVVKFTEKTKVFFGKATPEQIQSYVDTGEPMDKAGGYGIQGIGGTMIERIEGDYFTVMGLPLYRLSCEICKICSYNMKGMIVSLER